MQQTSFLWARTAALAAILTLTACNDAAAPVDVEIEEPAPAIALGETGLTVANARMVMAPVASNPAAVYFDLANTGETDATLQSVKILGVFDSQLHTTKEANGTMTMSEVANLPIPAGETLSLAPGGKHVMAFNVSPAIGPGSNVEVTVNLGGGREETFKAEVRAAGDER